MTVTAYEVAAELRARLPGMGVKKLHKLLYFCQGHHLADLGQPMFKERVSAWDMGPVVGELWHHENHHGQTPPARTIHDEGVLNTIGYVLSRYGALTADDLERLTHAQPPWNDADTDRPPNGSAPIARTSMQRFFRSDQGSDDELRPDPDELKAWLAGAEQRREDWPPIPDTPGMFRQRLRDTA